jgi:HEAT repeat protein
LALLAERDANRVRSILRGALLDRSARVRSLARFLAAKLDASIDVRALYLEPLDAALDRSSAAAIDGLGEVGTRDDADRLMPLLTVERPRIRRAALRALAQCDRDRALPAAISALEDPSGSVRGAAGAIVRAQRHRVDFATLHGRWRQESDPNVRVGMLFLLAQAPKWDAVVYLLDALVTDSSESMQRHASGLLTAWIAAFNRSQLQPSREHLQRIRAVLAAPSARVEARAARFLELIVEGH